MICHRRGVKDKNAENMATLIATAREDCPLGQVFEVRSGVIREDAERVTWDSFLPNEQQGI